MASQKTASEEMSPTSPTTKTHHQPTPSQSDLIPFSSPENRKSPAKATNQTLPKKLSSTPQNSTINTSTQRPKNNSFPFLYLPTELRYKIYAYYIYSLPPFNPTKLLLAATTPLHRIPFFYNDIPLSLLYSSQTFIFTSPDIIQKMITAASFQPENQTQSQVQGKNQKSQAQAQDQTQTQPQTPKPRLLDRIRRVKIPLGGEVGRGWDWVFLVLSSFPGLEGLEFEADRGDVCASLWSSAWWDCVRDAVREVRCCEGRRRNREGLTVNLRRGEIVVCERFG